jgi:hypothetical protein
MRAHLFVLIAMFLTACDNEPAPASAPEPETATRLKSVGPPPPPPPPPPAPPDRCVQVADHFEPWRANELWRDEVSPRAKLIADCRAQRWSIELTNCLLRAHSPLELDDCIELSPDVGG